jgi:hypothetical protein
LRFGIDGVDDGERAIVNLIDGQIAGELLLHPRNVVPHEADFFPLPGGPSDAA